MKINKENLIAGIIAIVALVSIICELIFGGVSSASVATAVKDITGIFIDIIVFALAFKVFMKKGDTSFRGKMEVAMETIEESYFPLIRKHTAKETNESDILKNQEFIRYDLARKVEALFGEECNDYMRFFELKSDAPEYINFLLEESFLETLLPPKLLHYI